MYFALCIWTFCRCAHMFTICMPAGSPVTGVMNGCELPCVCWGLCKSNKCSWSLSRLSMPQPHLLARTWNKVCNSVSFVTLKRPCASLGRTIYSQGHIRNCEDLVVFHREAEGPDLAICTSDWWASSMSPSCKLTVRDQDPTPSTPFSGFRAIPISTQVLSHPSIARRLFPTFTLVVWIPDYSLSCNVDLGREGRKETGSVKRPALQVGSCLKIIPYA